MAEAHWKTCDDTVLGLEADFEPKCVFCGTEMECLASQILNFALDLDKLDDYGSYAVDIGVICQKCGWVGMFGVAIEKEHYEKLSETRKDEIRELDANI